MRWFWRNWFIGPKHRRKDLFQSNLTDIIEEAKKDWLSAQDLFRVSSSQELADYAAYLILATERRYIYLWKIARREGFLKQNTNQSL
ncbi:Hypothetical protein LUCI_2204 [Lucifera butyrica]|uniref:DUF2508 domain-containing protein n=1 Tax=Lucifera butyrica TaxID=1351585 RepID=A0A498R7R0_9FIRM|nr:DUF2508 family protein [Lucifera butyrica]VBB06960.1 Hypothetical protein LUCI_2204 [Lucifera butyrica]